MDQRNEGKNERVRHLHRHSRSDFCRSVGQEQIGQLHAHSCREGVFGNVLVFFETIYLQGWIFAEHGEQLLTVVVFCTKETPSERLSVLLVFEKKNNPFS